MKLPHPTGDCGPYRFYSLDGKTVHIWLVGSTLLDRSGRGKNLHIPPTDGHPYWRFDEAKGEPVLIE